MIKDSVKQFLESNGLDTELAETPQSFETTEACIDPSESSQVFQTSRLFELAGCHSAETKMNSDIYWNVRRYYINQIRAQSRKEFFDKEKSSIQEIIRSQDINQIRKLFNDRHEWRKTIHNFRSDDFPICEVNNCTHIAIKGSSYCINHIVLDKNQKLYVECPNCHQPHPVFTNCLACH